MLALMGRLFSGIARAGARMAAGAIRAGAFLSRMGSNGLKALLQNGLLSAAARSTLTLLGTAARVLSSLTKMFKSLLGFSRTLINITGDSISGIYELLNHTFAVIREVNNSGRDPEAEAAASAVAAANKFMIVLGIARA